MWSLVNRLCQHTGTNTNIWIPPRLTGKQSKCEFPKEYIARSPLCDQLRKVQTTAMECPEEGAMSQDNQNNTENSQCFQESPCLSDGAEVMVCGSEIHADSEMTSLPTQDVYDAASETPDPNSTNGQDTGLITRLASSLFPFSLFYRKSSAN
ncbi:uncharacterized protein LOC127649312 [Xyrauchen texanus]|uniref:uncharacterized protein LOC127649312 n=1 Tax=Xyrauchen texanus TaxID=154827 RepID=UPI002242709D|nr:uncharacterized protein LOC127649312 [Xyrauchen texanus]